ncbi:MAG: hypothetical protein MUE40_14110 [Anaerolineae bacterium]|jgi:hypothetical protein|nr:hypothetical protein [Anaerolineae bacterium]
MYAILVHISGQEPVKLDVDELPKLTDTCVIGRNPRERSDKEITWVDEGVTTICIPWWRINYIQFLPTGAEEQEFDLPFR